MARASIPTLLSLDRWAKILGVTPAHFNQGVSSIVFPLTNSCPDVWYQFSHQAVDAISREDLALEIANAERDIAEYVGWWPAPVYIEEEVHKYPQHHRPDMFGLGGVNVRGGLKSVTAFYGKVIAPGQRAVELIASPATGVQMVFSDEDADGFPETVTITVAGITETTDACDLRLFFAGHGGAPEWEIRPARTKTLTAGTLVMTFWSWQFVDPDLWEEIPVAPDGVTAVDLDAAVYVATSNLYRVYTDTTATSATFYWEPQPQLLCSVCGGTGCNACLLTEQTGCIHIRDAQRGVVVPTPATYSTAWGTAAWSVCRDPDEVKINYCSGKISQRYQGGFDCDPLSDWWAQTIAMLATARLERPLCSCGNSVALAQHWREDLAFVGEKSYTVPFELLSNPFGTRRGEILAWQRVDKLVPGRQAGATAI